MMSSFASVFSLDLRSSYEGTQLDLPVIGQIRKTFKRLDETFPLLRLFLKECLGHRRWMIYC